MLANFPPATLAIIMAVCVLVCVKSSSDTWQWIAGIIGVSAFIALAAQQAA